MFDILKSVLRHFAVYGIGTLLNRIVGFLLIPVYTNYLSTTDYGTLELIELTTFISGMFLAAGITYAVLRFYYDTDSLEERRLIISSAHISTLAISVVFGLWLVIFASDVSELIFESQDNTELFRLAFVTLILSVTSEVPMGYIRAQQKSVLYTSLSIGRLVLSLTLNILFVVSLGWGIRGIILSALITQVLTTLVVSGYTFKQTGFGLSLARTKQMARYGLPLIPGAIAVYVLNFADRYLLPRYSSLSELGIYSLGYKFGMVISPLISEPFMAIWMPKMFEIAKREDAPSIYARMLTYFFFIELFVSLFISVIIQDVVAVMSDAAFHSAYQVVHIILLAYVLWGASNQVRIGILIAKKTKYIAYIFATAAVCNVGANLVLIPMYGSWGAAIATLLAFTIVLVMSFTLSRRFLRVDYQYGRILKMLLLAVALYFLAQQINVESLYWRLGLRVLCALSFPLLLAILGFYEKREGDKMKELLSSGKLWLQDRWSRNMPPT